MGNRHGTRRHRAQSSPRKTPLRAARLVKPKTNKRTWHHSLRVESLEDRCLLASTFSDALLPVADPFVADFGSSGSQEGPTTSGAGTVGSGGIRGTAWHDLNWDGQRDAGEPGLEDWKIYVDENANGQWDDGEPMAWTDANGNYAISVAPGTHLVSVQKRDGWLQTGPEFSDIGLMAHYPFTGHADDVSGNGYHGTVHGAALTADRYGTPDRAYDFSGGTPYIDTIPREAISSEITFAAWILPTGGSCQIWGSVYNPGGGKDGYVGNFHGDSVYFEYRKGNNIQGSGVTHAGSVPVGEWSHIAYTVDAARTFRIFVNGVLSASGSISTAADAHDRALMIGKSILLQNYSFLGVIDDVWIYDRALSQEEVAALRVASGGMARSVTIADGQLVDDIEFGFAQSMPLVVDTLADENNGDYSTGNLSLREALELAATRYYPGSDTIEFAPSLFASGPATIRLDAALGQLNVDSDVWIRGPGEHLLTLDADEQSRILEVFAGVSATLSGITLTGGQADNGSAIFNSGTLTLTATTVTRNLTHNEGTIVNVGHMTASQVTITDNTAKDVAALLVDRGGSFVGNGITVSANRSLGFGAIYNRSSSLYLSDSVIQGNATSGWGGGIVGWGGGNSTVVRTSFLGNSARSGGAIYLDKSSVDVTDSVFIGNSDTYRGGGIWGRVGGTVNVRNSLFANLTGDILASQYFDNVLLLNVSNSTITNGIYMEHTVRAVVHNTIVSRVDGGLDPQSSNNLIGIDPQFAKQPNPGPDGRWGTDDDEYDFRLTASSPAIDAGNNAFAVDSQGTPLTTDLGGRKRIQGQNVDIGAYEYFETVFVDTVADVSNGDYSAGDLSLREALTLAADESRKIERIEFADSLFAEGPATILLDGAALEITADVEIFHPDKSQLIIDAGSRSRVFHVHPDVTASLTGITVTGGFDGESGGGIKNDGTLVLANSAIIGNGTLGTYKTLDGGGIFNSGTLILRNSSVLDNWAASGGGISNAGLLTIEDSLISGNSAIGVYGHGGGGIRNGGVLEITATTFSDNWARCHGGAVRNWGGTVSITNSVFPQNVAQGTDGHGGALYSSIGSLTVTNSTLAGNRATNGGGIYVQSGSTVLNNTIVALNVADNGEHDIQGALHADSQHNLIGIDPLFVQPPASGADGIWGTGDDLPGDLRLTSGSAAIDAGLTPLAVGPGGVPLSRDVAGRPRVQGGTVDIGAFESPGVLVVDTLADEHNGDYSLGDLSLREALALVAEADGFTGPGEIRFAASLFRSGSRTIVLGGTQLDITTDVVIIGPGHALLTIDAGQRSRAFRIHPGVTATISGLTIKGGAADTGAGIENDGTLTVIDSTIAENAATTAGGGVHNRGGTLEIINSTIANNASQFGGGIFNEGEWTVRIVDSTVTGNTTTSQGGALHNLAGTLEIIQSTISDNSATLDGGAIYNGGTTRVENSTISNNTTAADGGGVYNAGTTIIVDAVIVGNEAHNSGGGIANSGTGSQTSLEDSMVGDNHSANGPDIHQGDGEVSGENNQISDGSGVPGLADGVDGNLIGIPPGFTDLLGNTIYDAIDLGRVTGSSTQRRSDQIGNLLEATRDVDIYKFETSAAGLLDVYLTCADAASTYQTFPAYLRLFDSEGEELSFAGYEWTDIPAVWGGAEVSLYLPQGTYYLGVSSAPNRFYSPKFANSGIPAASGTFSFEIALDTAATPPTPPAPEIAGELEIQFLSTERNGYYSSVLLNGVLKIEGRIYVDSDFTVRGQGTLSVAGTALYEGRFEFPAGQVTTDYLNGALGRLKIAGLDVHLDRLTLLTNGVKIEGGLALPKALGGVKVDFADPHYVTLTTNGPVYDVHVTAADIDLDLGGFTFRCQSASLALSNVTGIHVGTLTGTWGATIHGTPIVVNLDKAQGNYFRFASNGTWDLNGSLTVGRINFVPGVLYTNGFSIDVDTGTQTYYGEGSLRLPIGDGVTVFARAGIEQGYFDNAGICVQDLDIAFWHSPPVYLDRISGDVWNLTPDFVDQKPTKIEIGAGFQLGPDMGPYNLLYLDLDGWVDLGGGIGGEAALKIGKPTDPIARGMVGVDWHWRGDPYLLLYGSLEVGPASDAFLELDGRLVSKGNRIEGALTGGFSRDVLPSYLNWLLSVLGVSEQMTVSAYVQIVDDALSSNDYILAGIENLFAIRVDLVDDFQLLNNVHLIGYETLAAQLPSSTTAAMAAMAAEFTASGSGLNETYPIGPQADSALFEIRWETGTADFVLVGPDGTVYSQTSAAEHPHVTYGRFEEERRALFFVDAPLPGLWVVQIDDGTENGDASLRVFTRNAAPSISLISPSVDTDASSVLITWTAADADSDATIRVYYDTDRAGADGVLIADGLRQADATNAFLWDTSGVPTGDYYVYGVIDDGINLPSISYAMGRVSVVDADAPDRPTGLAVADSGLDWMELQWSPVDAADLSHYLIRYTAQADGEAYEAAISPGTATSFVLQGISAASSYRVTVAAIDVAGRISLNAEPIVVTLGETPVAGDVFAVAGGLYQRQVPGETGDVYTPVRLPVGAVLDAGGAITWTVPLEAAGWHEILVYRTDVAENTEVWRRFVLVDSESPEFGEAPPVVDSKSPTELVLSLPVASDRSGAPRYQVLRDGQAVGSWQPSTRFVDSGLTPNTSYVYAFRVRDNSPEQNLSDWSDVFEVTTAAAVPRPPVLGNPTADSFELISLGADPNPAATEYAVFCLTTEQYLATNGRPSQQPVWQTAASWAGTRFVGLEPDQRYEVYVVARNSEHLETVPGKSASIVTNREKIAPRVADAHQSRGYNIVQFSFSEPVRLHPSDLALLDASKNPVVTDAMRLMQLGHDTVLLDFSALGLTPGANYTVRLRGDSVQDFSANLLDGIGDGSAGTDYDFALAAAALPGIVVDTLADVVADDGQTSLREALLAADSQPGPDAILFDIGLFASGPAKIALAGSQLELASEVELLGPHAHLLTIDAGGLSRVICVPGGVTATIAGVTIKGGAARSDTFSPLDDAGGGILNMGMLTVTRAAIVENTARGFGGGIYNVEGPLFIDGQQIAAEGILTVTHSLIQGNQGNTHQQGGGGGIGNFYGAVNISHSTISHNASPDGGGIGSHSGTVHIASSIISNNSTQLAGYVRSGYYGGGVSNVRGTMTITNSVLAHNRAEGGYFGLVPGGGIANDRGTLIVTNSTIAGNSAQGTGGGIYNNAQLTLRNSIVSLNQGEDVFSTTTVMGGNNLIGVYPNFVQDPSPGGDGVWGTPDDQPGDFRLRPHSIAINAGDNAVVPVGLTGDLDGRPRIYGATVDLGAFEHQHAPTTQPEAASTVVTTLDDTFDRFDGMISLREAVWYAAAGQTITFDAPLSGGKISLSGGAILLDRDVVVDASALRGLTICAAGKSRVFTIQDVQVTLNGVTVSRGASTMGGGIANFGGMLTLNDSEVVASSADQGGGIYNAGVTTIVDSTVANNRAGLHAESRKVYGGGIFNTGTLLLVGSSVSDNVSSSGFGGYNYGGGIYNTGTLSLIDATIAGNEVMYGYAAFDGGGVYNSGTMSVRNSRLSENSANWGGAVYSSGTLTVRESRFVNNQAEKGGGAFHNTGNAKLTGSSFLGNAASFGAGLSNSGTLHVVASTISGNFQTMRYVQGGGGIHNTGTLSVANSTLSTNTAVNGGGLINHGVATVVNTALIGNSADFGGGIYNQQGSNLTAVNLTVTANAATARTRAGGGVFVWDTSTARFDNSIVALNLSPDHPDVSGPLHADSGFNLIGDGTGVSGIAGGSNGNIVGDAANPVDPLFVRPPDHGGDGWGDDPATVDIDESLNDDWGDLRLRVGSPAIDAGNNAFLPADQYDLDGDSDLTEPVPFDLGGNVRLGDGNGDGIATVDIGAYEFARPVLSIGVDLSTVTVLEGSMASNTGTWSIVGYAALSFTATLGTATGNVDGTWDWSFPATDGPVQSQAVTVTVTGLDASSASVTFDLVVQNVAPIIQDEIMTVPEDAESGTTVGTVSAWDPGDDELTYEIIDGAAATFDIDAASGEITVIGVLDFETTPRYTLLVRVTDKDGATSSATVVIDILDVNEPPVVAIGLQDQSRIGGLEFLFSVLPDSFRDEDVGDSLGLSATVIDGTPLPEWIVFDADSGSFLGSPSWDLDQQLEIQVTATDSGVPPLSVATSFLLVVTPNPVPWQNPWDPCDVNGVDGVTALDVLLLVSYLNAHDTPILPLPPRGLLQAPFYDVSGDGMATPLDALMVINFINSRLGLSGEGEFVSKGLRATLEGTWHPEVWEAVNFVTARASLPATRPLTARGEHRAGRLASLRSPGNDARDVGGSPVRSLDCRNCLRTKRPGRNCLDETGSWKSVELEPELLETLAQDITRMTLSGATPRQTASTTRWANVPDARILPGSSA